MDKLPVYRKCFVCGKDNLSGLKLFFYRENNCVCADFIAKIEHVGYGDRVHGGILASVMDEAMGWAPYIITGKMYYTWEMNIRYLHPVSVGLPVRFTAQMKEDRRRYVVSEGKITDNDGKVYIKATGKYFPMSDENQKEVLAYLETDS